MRHYSVLKLALIAMGLNGCGATEKIDAKVPNEPASSQMGEADSKKTKPSQITSVSLARVITEPFKPQRLHSFVHQGRPKDTYSLVYARDNEACSVLTNALNQPVEYIHNPRFPTPSTIESIRFFLGSSLSVDWITYGNREGQYSYTEADLDHDGVAEYYFRGHPRRGSQLLIKELPFRFEEDKNEGKSENWNRFDALMTKISLVPHFSFHESIDFGTSTNDEMFRAYRSYYGQFIEIVEIDDDDYLLIGGNIHLKEILKQDGTYEPLNQLVRILKKNPSNAPKKYSLICELRPKFVNELTTKEKIHGSQQSE